MVKVMTKKIKSLSSNISIQCSIYDLFMPDYDAETTNNIYFFAKVNYCYSILLKLEQSRNFSFIMSNIIELPKYCPVVNSETIYKL